MTYNVRRTLYDVNNKYFKNKCASIIHNDDYMHAYIT